MRLFQKNSLFFLLALVGVSAGGHTGHADMFFGGGAGIDTRNNKDEFGITIVQTAPPSFIGGGFPGGIRRY